MAGDDEDIELFDEVSAGLRDLHDRVRRLVTTRERKLELQGQLIAVTNSSKHDLRTAARRLVALRQDVGEAESPQSPASQGETPPW